MTRLWHISIAAERRTTLCVTLADCLAHVRRVIRAFGGSLLLYCVVDDHVHVVVEGPRGVVGPRVSGFVRSMRAAGSPLQAAHFTPVDGRRHLETLVAYVGNQSRKHGLPGHPALWPGSCFADMVGARTIDGWDPERLFAHLPRWRTRDVWNALGLRPLAPLPGDHVRRLGVWRIVDAAAAAFAVDRIDLYRRAGARRARRASVALATATDAASTELPAALDTTRRSINRLKRSRVPDEDLETVRLRLALEEALGLPREGIGAPSARATRARQQAKA